MDIRSITLSAGVRTEFRIEGRFFILIETGGPLDITLLNKSGAPSGNVARAVEAGFKHMPGNWADPEAGYFAGYILESDTAQTVKVGVSFDAGDYQATVGVVQVQQANDGTAAADQTVGAVSSEIAAANTSRKSITIQNVSAAGSGINIRVALGTTAVATTGLQLAPGQSVTFTSTAAVNAIREGGTDGAVSVTEETRT